MKKSLFKNLRLLGVAVPIVFGSVVSDAADVVPNTTNKLSHLPKSVFAADGKDPFFPRRNTAPGPKTAPSISAQVSDFVLNGITPFGARPTAIINGRTFEKGETGEVRLGGGAKVLVRCLEIKEKAVMITIDNSPQPVEVRMRPGQF
jgi:hypothetical protein